MSKRVLKAFEQLYFLSISARCLTPSARPSLPAMPTFCGKDLKATSFYPEANIQSGWSHPTKTGRSWKRRPWLWSTVERPTPDVTPAPSSSLPPTRTCIACRPTFMFCVSWNLAWFSHTWKPFKSYLTKQKDPILKQFILLLNKN